MIDQVERKPILAAAAVTAAAAAATFLLFMATGMLFILPLLPIMFVVRNLVVAYGLGYVAVPLAAAVFWRKPWWARWMCLGILLCNLGLMQYSQLAF